MSDPLLWTWDYVLGANLVRLLVFFCAVVLVGLTVRVTVTAVRAEESYRTWASISYGLLMACVALTVLIGYNRPLYIVPTLVFATAVFTGAMGARAVFTISPEWKRMREHESALRRAEARAARHRREDALRAEDRDLQDVERADSRGMQEAPDDLRETWEGQDVDRAHARDQADDERAHRRATEGDPDEDAP